MKELEKSIAYFCIMSKLTIACKGKVFPKMMFLHFLL